MNRGHASSVFVLALLASACTATVDTGEDPSLTENLDPLAEEPLAPPSCDLGTGQFCSVARVPVADGGPGVCSNAYSEQTPGCYNQMLPPLPSVTRSLSFTGEDVLTNAPHPTVRHFPGNNKCETGNCDQVLPFMQGTRDGRLSLTAQYNTPITRITAFRPENMGYDFHGLGAVRDDASPPETAQPTINQNLGANYDNQAATVELDYLVWHNPIESVLGTMSYQKVGATYSLDGPMNLAQVFCDPSSTRTELPAGQGRNPRRCTAKYAANGDEIPGVCYDVTHIIGTNRPYFTPKFGWGAQQIELVSVEITIFTAKPFSSHLGDVLGGITDPRAMAGVWIYPRNPAGALSQLVGGEGVLKLPPYQPYLTSLTAAKALIDSKIHQKLSAAPVIPYPTTDIPATEMRMKAAFADIMTDPTLGCYVSSAPGAAFKTTLPPYCEYWKNRRHRNEFLVDADGDETVGSATAAHQLAHWNGLGGGGNDLHNFEPAGPGTPGSTAMALGIRREFAEMTNTGDGRLIVFNSIGNSLSYMAMPEGFACRIDKIEAIRPMSQFPFDPAVRHYPLAQYQQQNGKTKPFLDADGTPFKIGEEMMPIYPWIDRDGRNLFFATSPGDRDNWFQQAPTNAPLQFNKFPSRTQPKIGMVMGAWTQGKIRILDDGSNLADWAPGSDKPTMKVGLYSTRDANGNVTGVQNVYSKLKQIQQFSSTETEWFHLDQHRPRLPFDVVWHVGTDSQRNLEVAFDDWIDRRAVIVAPMIALSKARPYNLLQKDGFERKNSAIASPPCANHYSGYHNGDGNFGEWHDDWKNCGQPADVEQFLPQYAFSSTPLLVNNAVENDRNGGAPASLELRGGARIEPVSLGGVRGKGVYLDGRNDYIATKDFPAYGPSYSFAHWMVSAFFDLRAQPDDGTERLLFAFGDGSYISLKKTVPLTPAPGPGGSGTGARGTGAEAAPAGPTQGPYFSVILYHSPSKTVKSINIGNAITEGRFFHFAAHITGREMLQMKSRTVKIFIDGTPIGSQTFDAPISAPAGFDIRTGQGVSRFFVGDPGPAFAVGRTKRTFKGWIDDLRLFKLDGTNQGQEYLEEQVCNHALGTLVDIGTKPGEGARPAIDRLRAAYRTRFLTKQTIPASLPYCEQLRLESHTSNLDIGPQRTSGAPRACVDYVHTNPNPDAELAARCLHKATVQAPNLVWNQARPDSRQTAFCQTCHPQFVSEMKGLSEEALGPHALGFPMWKDPRRQPLQPAPFLSGTYPGPDTKLGTRSHEAFYKRRFSATTDETRSTDACLADTGGYATPWYTP